MATGIRPAFAQEMMVGVVTPANLAIPVAETIFACGFPPPWGRGGVDIRCCFAMLEPWQNAYSVSRPS
jgi:hypothetical protein